MPGIASKNITIQIWTDLYYARCIGIWYPSISTDTPIENPDKIQEQTDNTDIAQTDNSDIVPYLLVLSSSYKPREEVMGNNPVAPGQHPIPKDFLETQIRHICYMFANDYGIFQPESKAHAKTFLAKQTMSYKKIKEIDIEVTMASGTMSLKDLRDSIDQYTEEEQKQIQVLTVGRHPNDSNKPDIKEFIYTDKASKTDQFIAVNKITPIYTIDDAYVDNSVLPDDPAEKSLPPNTADADMSKNEMNKTKEAKHTDNINREALKTSDKMKEDGKEPDRIEVLEKLLKEKDEKLIKAGLMEPIIQHDPDNMNPDNMNPDNMNP